MLMGTRERSAGSLRLMDEQATRQGRLLQDVARQLWWASWKMSGAFERDRRKRFKLPG